MSKSNLEIQSSKKDTSAETAKQIQDFKDKAAVTILVGFPSGRAHVETRHWEKEGENKGKLTGGEGPEIETSELAKMLSFGAKDIPPRPFLEDGIKSIEKNLRSAFEKEIKTLLNGGQPNWNKIGTMAVGGIQEFVRGDYYKSNAPNSKQTIERKGSDTPLIDGADLINSLTFIVDGK